MYCTGEIKVARMHDYLRCRVYLAVLPQRVVADGATVHVLILYNSLVSCLPCSNYNYADTIIIYPSLRFLLSTILCLCDFCTDFNRNYYNVWAIIKFTIFSTLHNTVVSTNSKSLFKF